MQADALMGPEAILDAIRREGDRMVHELGEHERRELETFRRIEGQVLDHEKRLRVIERFQWRAYGAIGVGVVLLSIVEALILRKLG